MKSALIVTNTEKTAAFIAEQLSVYSLTDFAVARTCGEARRALLERDFDLIIINAPLADETGEGFARQISVKGISQVILIVKSEIYDMVAAVCENDGVLTVAKPLSREMFRQALSLVKSTGIRLQNIRAENEGLREKIETIRLVDRAKSILIAARGMSEQEAHRYIEKKAMDTRSKRKAVAERIIKDYENATED
ncbi:MAG: ANTAR domain-containing response regulator [Christensenellales bacterium]|jgi:AmiR/NasT family two-component response regulator